MIGVAVITCNRPTLLAQCMDSIDRNYIDKLIVVNDGANLHVTPTCDEYIHNPSNLGVCLSKNIAMQRLLDLGCTYIFIVEDDMVVKDNHVWSRYIEVSQATGIHHMAFGAIDYCNSVPEYDIVDMQLKLWKNACGAFTFYTAYALSKVGLLDPHFNGNCWEHIEHTYSMYLNNLTTPFWTFADVNDAWTYLRNGGQGKSSIDNRKVGYAEAYNKGLEYFRSKHGMYVGHIPQPTIDQVKASLMSMYNNRKGSLQ